MTSNLASLLSEVGHRRSVKTRTSSQTDDFSSTPHTSFFGPEPMDLSAISMIGADHSVLGQERVQPSFCEPFHPVQKKERESYSQAELDVLYNSYIQWTYLNECLQKRISNDERNFMAQTHILWQENEKLRQRVADLDGQIAEARYLKKLDGVLEASEAENVVNGLENVRRCHTELAESLDTTRHQLPMDGIYLPCDVDTYTDCLTDTLNQALQMADTLALNLNMDPKALEDCTVAAKTLLNHFEEIDESVEFTNELAKEMKRLTVQESSLSVQKMMEKKKL